MQQSIARLGREVTTLRASLDQANKAAHTQIAKISERLEHATRGDHRLDCRAADDGAPAAVGTIAGARRRW